MDTPVIVWFRHDLRLKDNPALFHAAKAGSILPIFINDQTNTGGWKTGAASRCWLHQSLTSLNRDLAGGLRFFSGDPEQILVRLIKHTNARAIYWNRLYTPHTVQRDSQIKAQLKALNIEVNSFNGSLLWEPWQISKTDGTPYKVYTPFFKYGYNQAPTPARPLPSPARLQIWFGDDCEDQLELNQLNLKPDIQWTDQITSHWAISERGADDLLTRFLEQHLITYPRARDFPALGNTSRLSPYLQWGQISPRQIWYRCRDNDAAPGNEDSVLKFQQELCWREFSYYQLFHNPSMTDQNMDRRFDSFPWHTTEHTLHRWQQGQTGIPMIDAGMRELWQTGHMHNRVRMLTASFLVKNLMQHWLQGARWFWETLLDADLASNSASWQWVAGCGSDAAPYFRIFNPVTQGQKFDANGSYIRQYVPELNQLPDKYLHTPWLAPENVLEAAGVRLGKTYPKPMVDLKKSRIQALDSFKSIRN